MDKLLQSLILSASLGALIGMIRQWGEQQDVNKSDDRFAGLRTFVLWSLIGYTSALISATHAPYCFIAAVFMVGVHLVLHGMTNEGNHSIGFTTAAAAMLTVFLGGLVYWNHLLLAVMLAALTMLILGLKERSHYWTSRFTPEDIRSTLQFVAVTGVILPLVPNQGYGPYQAINLHSLWLMVVLISGLGFVGYLLIRILGTRSGVVLTGLVGGLASIPGAKRAQHCWQKKCSRVCGCRIRPMRQAIGRLCWGLPWPRHSGVSMALVLRSRWGWWRCSWRLWQS